MLASDWREFVVHPCFQPNCILSGTVATTQSLFWCHSEARLNQRKINAVFILIDTRAWIIHSAKIFFLGKHDDPKKLPNWSLNWRKIPHPAHRLTSRWLPHRPASCTANGSKPKSRSGVTP